MEKYKQKPEQIKANTLCANRTFHHWSYNKEHWLDVILVTPSQHSRVHAKIKYDPSKKMYHTLDGVLLDTKEKHYEYIRKLYFWPDFKEKPSRKETFTEAQISAHRRFLSFNYEYRTFVENKKMYPNGTHSQK